MQLDQAVYRAYELHVRIAPAHHLRDRQLLQGIGHDAAQHVRQLRTIHLHRIEESLRLAIHALRELRQFARSNTLGFQFLEQGG